MQNPTPDKVGRTFICSIVFLDIVEYSTQTVAKQLALKGWLNDILTQSLTTVSEVDRIILDTGDGVAMCFLGDPEEALFVSNNIRVALHEQKYPGLVLRTGVNLGPVKLVTDINGRPNIIGDGINVAQRVMSFAEPNQILVSRSYYEVVARLSDEYTKLFQYRGEHHDKHVRKHEVYEVCIEAPPDIQHFGTAVAHTPPQQTAPDATPAPAAVREDTAPPAVKSVGVFDEALLASLARKLAQHLGPIAPLIVAKSAKKAANADELKVLLADAIPIATHRETFLQALDGDITPDTRAQPGEARVSPAPSAPAPQAGSGGAGRATEAALPAIERLLATYIGPMSKILLAKAAKHARSDDELISNVAAGLDDERERAAFVNAAAELVAAHRKRKA